MPVRCRRAERTEIVAPLVRGAERETESTLRWSNYRDSDNDVSPKHAM